MARMTNRERLALVERIRTEGPRAEVDPFKPVYDVAEFAPDIGDRVKVWFADGHGGSATWARGGRWEFTHPEEMALYGPPVKWQELQPDPDVNGAGATRKKVGCNPISGS